jgi:hypothetical protein
MPKIWSINSIGMEASPHQFYCPQFIDNFGFSKIYVYGFAIHSSTSFVFKNSLLN